MNRRDYSQKNHTGKVLCYLFVCQYIWLKSKILLTDFVITKQQIIALPEICILICRTKQSKEPSGCEMNLPVSAIFLLWSRGIFCPQMRLLPCLPLCFASKYSIHKASFLFRSQEERTMLSLKGINSVPDGIDADCLKRTNTFQLVYSGTVNPRCSKTCCSFLLLPFHHFKCHIFV